MGVTVFGDFIVKGDHISDYGVKIVNGGEGKAKSELLTEESLKANVDIIRNRIENGRLWFPVCKYMMWKGLCPEGDFTTAIEILKHIYPEVSLNAKDLSSLNVLSFRKPLEEWDENDCPLKDRTTFNKYKNIATLLMNL